MERIVAALLIIFCSKELFAYGVRSHKKMALETIIDASVDNYPPTVSGGKTLSSIEQYFRETLNIEVYSKYNYYNEPRTGDDWIAKGSQDEDNGYRPLNHFYDPVYDDSLSSGMNRRYNFPNLSNSKKTPDWALEDTAGIANQDLSLKDAQDYLYVALTRAQSIVENV